MIKKTINIFCFLGLATTIVACNFGGTDIIDSGLLPAGTYAVSHTGADGVGACQNYTGTYIVNNQGFIVTTQESSPFPGLPLNSNIGPIFTNQPNCYNQVFTFNNQVYNAKYVNCVYSNNILTANTQIFINGQQSSCTSQVRLALQLIK